MLQTLYLNDRFRPDLCCFRRVWWATRKDTFAHNCSNNTAILLLTIVTSSTSQSAFKPETVVAVATFTLFYLACECTDDNTCHNSFYYC